MASPLQVVPDDFLRNKFAGPKNNTNTVVFLGHAWL
jgi:hypothetical protein